jgi:hypothetical protein
MVEIEKVHDSQQPTRKGLGLPSHVSMSFNIFPLSPVVVLTRWGKRLLACWNWLFCQLALFCQLFFFFDQIIAKHNQNTIVCCQGRNKGIRKATGAKALGVGLLSRLSSVSRALFAVTRKDRLEHA